MERLSGVGYYEQLEYYYLATLHLHALLGLAIIGLGALLWFRRPRPYRSCCAPGRSSWPARSPY